MKLNIDNFSKIEQKDMLVSFVQQFFAKEKGPISLKDFESNGVTNNHIEKLFGNLQKLCILAGIPTFKKLIKIGLV